MRFTENRLVARIVLAATVALCLILSGGGALVSLRDDARSVYYAAQGTDADLRVRAETAETLATLAESYGADKEQVSDVRAAAKSLAETKSISAAYAANASLTQATESLYTSVGALSLSDADAKYATGLYKELKSRNEIIGHSDYNERADAFNQKLNRFPAKWIGLMRGVRALELFR